MAILGFLVTIAGMVFHFGCTYTQVNENTKDISSHRETVSGMFQSIQTDQRETSDNLIHLMAKLNIEPLHTVIRGKITVADIIPIYKKSSFK